MDEVSSPVLTEELREAHRSLSEVDLRFREYASASPQLLSYAEFRVPESYREMLSFRLQPWPTFIDRHKREEIARVSVAVSDLVKSVPHRVFGGDPVAVSRFYGLASPEEAEDLLSEPNGIAEIVARGDLIATADGFKCIEFNFATRLGGWESTILSSLHLSSPAIIRFLQQEGIRPAVTPTTRCFFRHILEEVERRGLARGVGVNIAFAFHERLARTPIIIQGVARLGAEWDQVCRETGRQGKGRLLAATWQELSPGSSGQGLSCRGLPVHAVVEQTTEPVPEPVYRCFKEGGTCLFNTPVTTILTSKMNVALLSEHEGSGRFSPEEREVIRRHIPWSRRVVRDTVDFRGETAYLPDLLAARKEDMVLKEAQNLGGKGVAVGRFTAADRWADLCRSALENGEWIVQEYLESTSYLFQSGDHGCTPHNVIWGPFVFGSTYAGLILRMQSKAVPGVVNLSQTATEGVVFEV